jgi:acetyl-CoA/propionyl-CoA carboxylase biotin carboxyl carrier protein
VDYTGAGTVEFLLDANGEDFYFLEMNTRLQVEHPVTELVTGLDLVELQLRVAAGEELPVSQDEVVPEGHAIEVRVYAEDPAVGFLPQTGTLERFGLTFDRPVGGGDDVRLDSGVEDGSVVSPHYDPMLAKLVVHDGDRAGALRHLRLAVRHLVALGVRTNIEWLGDLLDDPAVADDDVATDWLDSWQWDRPATPAAALAAAAVALAPATVPDAATSPWDTLGPVRTGGSGWVVHLTDRDVLHRLEVTRTGAAGWEVAVSDDLGAASARHCRVERSSGRLLATDDGGHTAEVVTRVVGDTVWVHADGRTRALVVRPATRHLDLGAAAGTTALESPMPGSVVTVDVEEGDEVTAGQTLMVVEAMKMEHPVTAPVDGTIVGLAVAVGDPVDAGQALVTVEAHDVDEAAATGTDGDAAEDDG